MLRLTEIRLPLDHPADALPAAGLVEVIDGEAAVPLVVDMGSRAVREHFSRLSASRAERVRMLCRRHEVDLIELGTDRPYEVELFTFFRRRAMRLARG